MSDIQPNPRSALFKKILKFREIVNKQDWANDKTVSIPSRGAAPSGYGYLSVDKIKKTMAPIFVEAGLDFKPDLITAENDTSLGKNHWIVTMKMILTDIDTCETDETTVMGEAMDNQDKGLIKAQSYALKTYFVNKFDLADGMDPDKIASDYESFRKSPEEIAEMRKKILEKSAPKEEPKEEPVKEEPKEEPKKTAPAPKKAVPAPKKEEPVKEAPAEVPEKPKTARKTVSAPKKAKKEEPKEEETGTQEGPKEDKPAQEAPKATFAASAALENTIVTIINTLTDKAKAGQLTPEVYNEMSMARAEMASDADAKAFIRKYRSMTR